jgi:hypothetical protein
MAQQHTSSPGAMRNFTPVGQALLTVPAKSAAPLLTPKRAAVAQSWSEISPSIGKHPFVCVMVESQ